MSIHSFKALLPENIRAGIRKLSELAGFSQEDLISRATIQASFVSERKEWFVLAISDDPSDNGVVLWGFVKQHSERTYPTEPVFFSLAELENEDALLTAEIMPEHKTTLSDLIFRGAIPQ